MHVPMDFLEDNNPQAYNSNTRGYMARIQQLGKEELEQTCSTVAKRAVQLPPIIAMGPQMMKANTYRMTHPEKQALMNKIPEKYAKYLADIPRIYEDVQICVADAYPPVPKVASSQFKNPFDIERHNLLDQLEKMTQNFNQQVDVSSSHVLEGGMPGMKIKLQHAEELHNLPVAKMGKFEEYDRRLRAIGLGPQRELEAPPVRKHEFGNPFKVVKSLAVDEVGEVDAEQEQNGQESTNGAAKVPQKTRKKAVSENTSPPATSSISNPIINLKGLRRKRGPIDYNAVGNWKRRLRSASDSSSFYTDDDRSMCSEDNPPPPSVADDDDEDVEMGEYQ